MKRVISKQITALWPGGGLLQDQYFRDIRERLNWSDRYTQKEDTGIENTKKTVIPQTGFGSNDRGHNSGAGGGLGRDQNESNDNSLSSGYNNGEAAQDETGPGQTVQQNDPYYTSDVFNELFMDLKLKGETDKDRVKKNLHKILNGPSMPIPHRRYQTGD